jgi:rhamnose utilization protein RhaD (predicted bifunctional aldolase and dehydrogenase)/NAD(P)-dependent dehydrogenase (short-subunit alcohol dehydrogenase family)
LRNEWNDAEAPADDDVLGQCVYGSRLLGGAPDLVLHGGGNTSVKTTTTDVLGTRVDTLYVKGSGWDLATIEAAGFAPLRLSRMRELIGATELRDTQMMNEFRCALLDSGAPNPSVESLVHAFLPHVAVQHSHADPIVTLTNLADGPERVREVFGDAVVVVPYRMPGFDLVQAVSAAWPAQAGDGTIGMVLLGHGLFTFGDTTREAYARHIDLITRAEEYLAAHAAPRHAAASGAATGSALPAVAPVELARLRAAISAAAGAPMIVSRHADERVAAFVSRDDLAAVSGRGPATPDHIIRTKLRPMVGTDVDAYVRDYRAYFDRNAGRSADPLTMLDPAPRVVLDPVLGLLTVGQRARDAAIAEDIYRHTMDIIDRGEALGGYRALPEADLFDVEYWDLEQAKLRRGGKPPALAGQVALVTGAASGIGRACAKALLAAGASVIGLDLSAEIATTFGGPEYLGIPTDVTDADAVDRALRAGVERFGGLDILVVSAGIFPESEPIARLHMDQWRRAMAVNVDAVAALLQASHPLLALAPAGGSVVLIASKNVPAPGPGAASYSASKGALTQLGRVAALEWAGDGIRVNMVHPDAVFDTALWTPELLAQRAAKYGLSVEDYKRRNLLRREVSSDIVASMTLAMCQGAFSCTTGAQVPVDGGNDRVV